MKYLRLLFGCMGAMLMAMPMQLPAFETVVIDPGHGGNDEGTAWYHVTEKVLTIEVARRLEALLKARGIATVMTRRYDTYVSLEERAAIGNNNPNSVFVSIHFNASPSHDVSGFQSFYFFASPASRVVAESIQQSMITELPSRSRGVTANDYAVLWRNSGLAVLIECAFISNKEEGARVSTPEGQQAIAEAIADGLMRIKPVICNDPPETEIARCEIYHKRYDDAARHAEPTKHMASSSTVNVIHTQIKKKKKKKSA